MASQEVGKQFTLYITHVDSEGPFLKLSGQCDSKTTIYVESLIKQSKDQLESNVGMMPSDALLEGIICLAKYKDGLYYRAKIISRSLIDQGLVSLHFIDYGNKDMVQISNIKSIHVCHDHLSSIPPQATEYLLSRVMEPTQHWNEIIIDKLRNLLCYSEFLCAVELKALTYIFIALQYKNVDFSNHLVSCNYGIKVSSQQQQMILEKYQAENNPQQIGFQMGYQLDSGLFVEHIPFGSPHNFPSNPAAAMRVHNVPSMQLPRGYVPPTRAPFSVPPPAKPSNLSQRLVIAKTPKQSGAVLRQPKANAESPTSIPATVPVVRSSTYKVQHLEIDSTHEVQLAFVEDGPSKFFVHLVANISRFQSMMDEMNKQPVSSLRAPPISGTVCLGRNSNKRVICRTSVAEVSETHCLLYFVDYGIFEQVAYHDIFDIPEEFLQPEVFAHCISLSKVKTLPSGPGTNEAFRKIVTGQRFVMKIVPPEGPPLVQYGDLYLNGKRIWDMLSEIVKPVDFPEPAKLPHGSSVSVMVSYVDSCLKFYVQLCENIDALDTVMENVQIHCDESNNIQPIENAACCALFPEDERWYRARILKNNLDTVLVSYVDYGNEQEVPKDHIKPITSELALLPAQAIRCSLKGFEDKPVDQLTSNQLEMLALEKTLLAKVVGQISDDSMLVTLVDESVSPPMDVAKRMLQLAQPRGSKSDSQTKENPAETAKNDERGQRGTSFRNKEDRSNKENFDRQASTRQSEKWNTKSDRGDNWDENSNSRSGAKTGRGEREQWSRDRKSKQHTDRRDRQAGKSEQFNDKSSVHSSSSEGVAKREQKSSVQQRLRRDNQDNKDWDNKERRDNWGDKGDSRAERKPWNSDEKRAPRGDRRSNWNDNKDEGGKKDDWGSKNDWGDKKDNRNDRRGNWAEKKDSWDGNKEGGWGDNKDDRNDKRGNWAEKKDRWDSNKEGGWGDNKGRGERNERRTERGGGDWGSKRGDDDRHNRSFGSNKDRYGPPPSKELPNPLPLDTQYESPTIDIGSQVEVSVAWLISPESFYAQIVSLQSEFIAMMNKIPELYKGVKNYSGSIEVGSTVLARFPEDKVLYRATVLGVQPLGKYIVQYIDFGNKHLVEAKDIWQLDADLMVLPKMAVHCSLSGVQPLDGEFKTSNEMDLCFNAPRYQCIFQEQLDDRYKVSLWNNSVSVAQMLADKGLCKLSEDTSGVTLKDEPIDLNMAVGQQMMCKVTHTESFDKIYIQLDLNKVKIVEAALETYDQSLLVPLTEENLVVGTHCLLKLDDKLFRAIITKADDKTAFEAALPDYGKTVTSGVEQFMFLPTELSAYYYQSLECCLNNYTPESNKLMNEDELKAKLDGNKFIVYVNDVDETRLLVTFYDHEKGSKVALFEPDEGAYDSVSRLCMRAVYTANFGLAYMSHAETLNEIYLQHSDDADTITDLLEKLFNFYDQGTPESLESYEVDAVCAAKSEDGNWYRAIITSIEENEVRVQYIDYGNSETVPKDMIKKLDDSFYEPYALAVVAELGLTPLTDDALDKFKTEAGESELLVTLAASDAGWRCALHCDGVDLAMSLINQGLAALTNNSAEIEEIKPTEDGRESAFVSHADTPGQFWLQFASDSERVEKIQSELQANADNYTTLNEREVGTVCIAKYSVDEQWYRAVILDADCDIVTVRFTDYGNTDVLTDGPDILKALPQSLESQPPAASRCSVDAVPAGTGQWTEAAAECFQELLGDLEIPVRVKTVLPGDTTYVEIMAHGKDITEELVKAGYASRQNRTEGSTATCYASHINSPSEFWIQLESSTTDLEAIEAAMAEVESFSPVTAAEEGALVAALYPEDGAWYRAQILTSTNEGAEVLFIDYGNASLASELRELPESLCALPALARKCALQKPITSVAWSAKAAQEFENMAAEGATVFQVKLLAGGDVSIVELFLDDKSVTESLLGFCQTDEDNVNADKKEELVEDGSNVEKNSEDLTAPTQNNETEKKEDDQTGEDSVNADKKDDPTDDSSNVEDQEVPKAISASVVNEKIEDDQMKTDKETKLESVDESQNIETRNTTSVEEVGSDTGDEFQDADNSKDEINESLESNQTVIENMTEDLQPTDHKDSAILDTSNESFEDAKSSSKEEIDSSNESKESIIEKQNTNIELSATIETTAPEKSSNNVTSSPEKSEKDVTSSPEKAECDVHSAPEKSEPKESDEDVTELPEKIENDVTSSPEKAGNNAPSSPEKASNDAPSSPEKAECEVQSSPEKSEKDVSSSPEKSEKDVSSSPEESETDVTSSPEKSKKNVTTSPEKAGNDVTTSPEKAGNDVTKTSQEKAGNDVTSSPEKAEKTTPDNCENDADP